jgi:hypothetical protein
MKTWPCASAILLVYASAAWPQDAGPGVSPPGAEKTAKTQALETGARMLQGNSPPEQMNVYLVGFHPMKAAPEHQMEAHHFCRQVNQDFAQCALFDGNTEDANLNGIEYIVSEKLFEQLPPDERQYWHPHNFEILSGQLVAPGIPQVAEQELMQGKMNSYGKTWHVWNTGAHGLDNADRLPLGEPRLAWSFNRDGEARPGLVERMEERVGVDTRETREARQELVPLAKPQEGVDALEDEFRRETTPIPGVVPKAN